MKRYIVKMADNSTAVVHADDAEQAKEAAEIMYSKVRGKKVKAVSARLIRACGK